LFDIPATRGAEAARSRQGGPVIDLQILRVLSVLLLGAVGFFFRPFQLDPFAAFGAGILLGVAIIVVDRRLRRASVKQLLGAALGSLAGVALALLASLILNNAAPSDSTTVPFIQVALLIIGGYLGLSAGVTRAPMWRFDFGASSTVAPPAAKSKFHILDTSVIIDGRIADIAETGFIDGGLAIPQFVLRELQLVADSADSLKRNRGRRGLDVLQRLQKMPQISVQILEEDFPHVRDVDMKLVELGKVHKCKVMTNDFNLNKVAQLHGVTVLNINELANALKPIVLPGEIMRVFVLKEGKEYNQGVAYLDDGTMVVVDNARRLISKTIDISVTSVLQTTAGKMIFGRFDDRLHAVYEKPQSDERKRETSAVAPQP
jgi:uncharacterized protein YacL